jgi:hypothetical protein
MWEHASWLYNLYNGKDFTNKRSTSTTITVSEHQARLEKALVVSLRHEIGQFELLVVSLPPLRFVRMSTRPVTSRFINAWTGSEDLQNNSPSETSEGLTDLGELLSLWTFET